MKSARLASILVASGLVLVPSLAYASLGGIVDHVTDAVNQTVSGVTSQLPVVDPSSVNADTQVTVNDEQVSAGANVAAGDLAGAHVNACLGDCAVTPPTGGGNGDGGNGGNNGGGGNGGNGGNNGGSDNGGNTTTGSTGGTVSGSTGSSIVADSASTDTISGVTDSQTVAFGGPLSVDATHTPTLKTELAGTATNAKANGSNALAVGILAATAVLAAGVYSLKRFFPDLSLSTELWPDK